MLAFRRSVSQVACENYRAGWRASGGDDRCTLGSPALVFFEPPLRFFVAALQHGAAIQADLFRLFEVELFRVKPEDSCARFRSMHAWSHRYRIFGFGREVEDG